jgi:hypothetical protein
LVAVSGSGALCVMPAGLAWCSRVVAGECCCRVLLPHLSPVVIDDIDCVGAVVIAAHPPARGSPCRTGGAGGCRPGCISRYRRHLADLPVAGRPVLVWLPVRRFFCDHVDCSACTFVEQIPGLAERPARPASSAGGHRVGVGRAARLAAGHQIGNGGEPVDAAAPAPRVSWCSTAAGSPRQRAARRSASTARDRARRYRVGGDGCRRDPKYRANHFESHTCRLIPLL